MADIPSGLLGLLQQAADEQPWTCERRDLWMAAFCPTLDFSFTPTDFEEITTEENGDEDSDDLKGVGDDLTMTDDDVDAPDAPRVYVKWKDVVACLAAGLYDDYKVRKRSAGASSFKSELCKKFAGIMVKIHDDGDGWSTVTVTLGAYQEA